MVDELVRQRDRLWQLDCPMVAMKTTGECWRRGHNVPEGCVELGLITARQLTASASMSY
jgi:hypothetical protein